MAKEKPTDKDDRKREKKEKKERRSEKEGVHKSKSDKKEKKLKTAEAEDTDLTTKLLNTLEDTKPGSVATKQDDTIEVKIKTAPPLLGALVPFANPLADEKIGKKVLKSVKKAAKNKSLKRGVKEVVKSLRKSPPSTSTSTTATPQQQQQQQQPPGIVILAADISPMDVISHIPVLCEDHGIPYIFVPSRAELGAAGSTKRPTSVVMVGRERVAKAGEEEEGWGEVFGELVKVVEKAGRGVRV